MSTLPTLLLLSLIVSPSAQDPGPAEQLREKLASPFLQRADWTTDYDEAKRRAASRGQLVFGYFTTAGY